MKSVNNKELFSFMHYRFLIKISDKSLFVRIAWRKHSWPTLSHQTPRALRSKKGLSEKLHAGGKSTL